jgi:diadenosine tetraphosphatase ApaH/serine/threonine PP2A family protein phosphatase
MRILVISDIHSNLTALEIVLASAGQVDGVWCLGDLVGYGPDPDACIARLRELPNFLCILGNHDAAVSGLRNIDKFNDEAEQAILVTRAMISAESVDYLKNLPETIETDSAILAHGSPRNPIWEYILDPVSARMAIAFIQKDIGFVGHTHLPLCFTLDQKSDKMTKKLLKADELIHIHHRMILNPGSVGQPRDHDPRASYGIYDTEENSWQIHRVEYDIPSVQQRILAAGLPERHALRLTEGW